MIIIPAIDLKEGKCVRLKQGLMDQSTIFSENPAEMARKWVDLGAKKLHLVHNFLLNSQLKFIQFSNHHQFQKVRGVGLDR